MKTATHTFNEMMIEIKAAHQIIKNALNLMTVEQKMAWSTANERDDVSGEGTTRANEREAAIAKAELEANTEFQEFNQSRRNKMIKHMEDYQIKNQQIRQWNKIRKSKEVLKFAQATNNKLFKNKDFLIEAVETEKTIEDVVECSKKYASCAEKQYGEVAGFKFIAWSYVQINKNDQPHPLSVIDFGKYRLKLWCDLTKFNEAK